MSTENLTVETEAADDGTPIPVGNLAKTYAYSGGLISYSQVTYEGATYRKTYTYTAGNLTGISLWVKQ